MLGEGMSQFYAKAEDVVPQPVYFLCLAGTLFQLRTSWWPFGARCQARFYEAGTRTQQHAD